MCSFGGRSPVWLSERKLVVAIDSEYAYARLQGAAYRWRDNGWVSATGTVSNVDLWQQLLEAIQSSFTIFQWVKIPSHVGLHGNDAADELANRGRLMSPLHQSCKSCRPTPPPPCRWQSLYAPPHRRGGRSSETSINPDVPPMSARWSLEQPYPPGRTAQKSVYPRKGRLNP